MVRMPEGRAAGEWGVGVGVGGRWKEEKEKEN